MRQRAEQITFWSPRGAAHWWLLGWVAAGFGCANVPAAELTVSVQDPGGHPVAEVVVTAVSASGPARSVSPDHAETIMDQHNLAFVPQVLVVAAGSNVRFPNNDSVSHQVYSFSPAKRFQLPLYKGAIHPPVNFDKPGLVVLGCNIHDQMVGYIYVTDAPWFGKTDAQGIVHWSNVPPETYSVTLWSPYIADDPASLVHSVSVTAAEPAAVAARLNRELRASPLPRPRRADWDY